MSGRRGHRSAAIELRAARLGLRSDAIGIRAVGRRPRVSRREVRAARVDMRRGAIGPRRDGREQRVTRIEGPVLRVGACSWPIGVVVRRRGSCVARSGSLGAAIDFPSARVECSFGCSNRGVSDCHPAQATATELGWQWVFPAARQQTGDSTRSFLRRTAIRRTLIHSFSVSS